MPLYRTLKQDVEMLMENHDTLDILRTMRSVAGEMYRRADDYDRIHCMQDRAPSTAARWALRIMVIEKAIRDHERTIT